MSYALLTSLYYGEGSNADLTGPDVRARLHLSTRVEQLVEGEVRRGRDVVLTGNPGDGKSHLVRTLQDRGVLGTAEVVRDLSARRTADVLSLWERAVTSRRPFVLCGNEGPLVEFLHATAEVEKLGARAKSLTGQLRHLLVSRAADLPPPPTNAVLIDLAERNVLDRGLIEQALARVAREDFLPPIGPQAGLTSAGQNLLLLAGSKEARSRLAACLASAGRRSGEHVTFRQLWQAVAFAVTANLQPSTLRVHLSQDRIGLGTFPLDNLARTGRGGGRGALIEAARRFGDPSSIPSPELDEELWTVGKPTQGRWNAFDAESAPVVTDPPAALWARGDRSGALELQRQLKRIVAIAHDAGAVLIERLESEVTLTSYQADDDLCSAALRGLRALYLSPDEERGAPEWLHHGLPLWVSLSYEDVPVEERPHVAVRVVPASEFEILRPVRAPWLGDALGPLPDMAWLAHRASGIALRLDGDLLATLGATSRSSGPALIPEPVRRFLAQLAGLDEVEDDPLARDDVAILRRPRGRIEAEAAVETLRGGGARYA